MFDLILRGGSVLNGTGSPMSRADVGIEGDKITAVGDLAGSQAARILNCQGLYLPGMGGVPDAYTLHRRAIGRALPAW